MGECKADWVSDIGRHAEAIGDDVEKTKTKTSPSITCISPRSVLVCATTRTLFPFLISSLMPYFHNGRAGYLIREGDYNPTKDVR